MDSEIDLRTADRDVLIGIIVRQQAIIERLEKCIERLEKCIERLEKCIAQLEGQANPKAPAGCPV